jgi:hypothetical protein
MTTRSRASEHRRLMPGRHDDGLAWHAADMER